VLALRQAGLFDVMLDTDFSSNGQLFRSFAHGTPEANDLRLVSARFDG
jgi:aldose sugar dehydrogenase